MEFAGPIPLGSGLLSVVVGVRFGLPTSQQLANQVLNHPVAEEKGEYTG